MDQDLSRSKVCFYCERPYGVVGSVENKALFRTKDHIIPISKGGNNRSENIVYCCMRCNKMKGGLFLEEFAEYIKGFISKTKNTRTHYTIMLCNVEKLIEKISPIKERLIKTYVPKKYRTKPQKLPPDQLLSFLSEDWQKRFGGGEIKL